MNLMARAKLSSIHMFFCSPSPPRRLLLLRHITALQHGISYSTKITRSSQNVQRLTRAQIQKPKGSSSMLPQRINGQIDWPRPRGIQYESEVVNSVNLIGYVKIPVLFEVDSNGRHLATTVIYLENGNERKYLSISAVFEGELAHIVAYHVKPGDYVFISGHLCFNPMRTVLIENIGKCHVVVDHLNFVEGFEKKLADKANANDIRVLSKSGVGKSDSESLQVKLNDSKGNRAIKKQDGDQIAFEKADANEIRVHSKSGVVHSPSETDSESLQLKFNNKRGKRKRAIKKHDGDQILDLWRDLVKNPNQWWDYRSHKSAGLVKENFPDFKKKGSREAVWIDTAPQWVLSGLKQLEFDNPKGFQPEQNKGKLDDSWRNLAENPDKWWDNRMGKRSPKAPDFRHKVTGEGLWLDTSPACVIALSVLQPLKDSTK